MRLKNKKTGEIIELELGNYKNPTEAIILVVNHEPKYRYETLTELNAEWEDYRPLEEFWFINSEMSIVQQSVDCDRFNKEIGNYFETKEEAEKAVEKLKAWKRLRDTYHIRFDLDFVKNTISFTYRIDGTLHSAVDEERIVFEDMETIFGGEE